jgi:hypothetical protein
VRIERVLGCHPLLAFGIGLTERFSGPHSSMFLPAIRWHVWRARVSHRRGERANHREHEVSHRHAPAGIFPQCAVLHSQPSGVALPSRSFCRTTLALALTGQVVRHAVGARQGAAPDTQVYTTEGTHNEPALIAPRHAVPDWRSAIPGLSKDVHIAEIYTATQEEEAEGRCGLV